MAEQHFTQIDAGALQDWLGELLDVALATQFVLDLGNLPASVRDFQRMTTTLRIISSVLVECVEEGHRRYVP